MHSFLRLSKERIRYPPEDGVITFLCILYFNNLYVLCAFVGNIWCMCKMHGTHYIKTNMVIVVY
jgi:hypothetical protein